jgi:tetratricopeptide (TPR) repeat protein
VVLLSGFGIENEVWAQKKKKKDKEQDTEQLNEFKVKERTSAFMEGNKQKILGNWDEAEANFKKALMIDPNHTASMYELARIYWQQGRVDDAILLGSKAVSLDPENNWYQILLADLYKSTQQYDKVVEVFQNLITFYPNKIDYRYDLAMTYIIMGEYKEAIDVYNQVEEIIGVTESVSMKKRSLWSNLGKLDKAIGEVERLVDDYPYDPRYLQILAESYVKVGKYDKALETYERVVEIDPENPYIHISLSDLYRKTGDAEMAYQELKLGFANPELDLDSKIQIFLTYYSIEQIFNGKSEQALELSEILVNAHPGNPRVMSLYGDLLYRSGQPEKALGVINDVLNIDESNYAVWEQKLFIENELLQNDSLVKTSKTVSELFPMQPLPYLFNGFANTQLKNYEAAAKSLQTGSKLVVGNDVLLAQFYTSLGDVFNQLKEYHKSDEYYEKSLTIKPADAYVLNNYSYYLSLRNVNLEKAKQMAARANDLQPNNLSFMDTYGWVLYQLEEYEQAEIWVKRAIDNEEKDSAVLLEHYGDILYQLGRKDEALEYWKSAKELGGEASEFLDQKIRDKKLYE